MKPGDEVELAGYAIQVKNLREEERPNPFAWIAALRVSEHGDFVANLFPEKRVYFHRNPDPSRRQPHSEIDIHSGFQKDIYAVLGEVDSAGNTIALRVMINHLVRFVWIGGGLILLGTVIALWPDRREV